MPTAIYGAVIENWGHCKLTKRCGIIRREIWTAWSCCVVLKWLRFHVRRKPASTTDSQLDADRRVRRYEATVHYTGFSTVIRNSSVLHLSRKENKNRHTHTRTCYFRHSFVASSVISNASKVTKSRWEIWNSNDACGRRKKNWQLSISIDFAPRPLQKTEFQKMLSENNR